MGSEEKLPKFRCGIEIHRRLNTRKLFCNCKSKLDDAEVFTFFRYLGISKSEMEEIDPAALHEYEKGKVFEYVCFKDSTCLVEMDEEPPHEINKEALQASLQIAKLLNMNILDEIHFMRKIVVDGSNTSGFQRTAMIGLNGQMNCSFGSVPIPTLCLEEESAQILEKGKKKTKYGLNRLCIPLVEIATAPVLDEPWKVKEAAKTLGDLLKCTGKVMRGLGSIRQDINISLVGQDARVEIKGAQDLNKIEEIVVEEVKRQKSLVDLAKELEEKEIKIEKFDVTDVFANTKCKILKGKVVICIVVKEFKGFFARKLNSFRTLGKEIANYVRAKTELKGIIHSDEEGGFSKYGISEEEKEILKERTKAGDNDLIILVAFAESEKREGERAIDVIVERVKKLKEGVLPETRKALENGDTEYMRPLPGAARMYPETDVPVFILDKDYLENIEIPETFDEKMKRYEALGLNKEMANQIIVKDLWQVFDELCKTFSLSKEESNYLANLLVNVIPEVESREKIKVEMSREDIISIVRMVCENKIVKDCVYDLVIEVSKSKENPEVIVEKKNWKKVDLDTIKGEVEEMAKKGYSMGKIMGEMMKKYKNRVDGKELSDFVRKILKNRKSR